MKVLVLDNYDSFTYNLVHIIRELKYSVEVYRNDKITMDAVGKFDKILLSPGPGIPDEAGIMKAVIRNYGSSKSILGVCLGHQGIGEVYGARLFNLPSVLHGITSTVEVVQPAEKLFNGVPAKFEGTHYHSWAIVADSIPPEIEVTALNSDGLIMAISHRTHDVRGVQFHPESVMTLQGKKIIENWLKL